MGKGHNLVLFDQCAAQPIKSINILVTSVSHRHRVMPHGALIFHDWPYDEAGAPNNPVWSRTPTLTDEMGDRGQCERG